MNNSEQPETKDEPVTPSAMDVACSKGAVIGGIVALLLSLCLIGSLILSEQLRYGHANLDKAIGIGFLPILAVPIGVVLGTLFGMMCAAIKR